MSLMCLICGCRDTRMELQFQRRWALKKSAQDRAAVVFLILSALLTEAGGPLFGYFLEASADHCVL